MTQYQLRSTQNNSLIFEGNFTSFRACLEHAVNLRLNLEHIDLSHKNLSNAHLDEALLRGANFTGTNLSGANLSDSQLSGACFDSAALYNTCLALSDLEGCNFENASFGATDIHGTILDHARFSTLSCFSLDFTRARQMGGCHFVNPDGRICRMSRPPIVIRGLGREPLVLMDEDIKAGHNLLDRTRLERIGRKLTMRALKQRLGTTGAA
ncbi:MAG: pentapeptide repeat-containing protein [Alphaproteobacteria bacterium]|nr:pentapeptide repeat-containing protein [Alphaproteobacteria bacterium]